MNKQWTLTGIVTLAIAVGGFVTSGGWHEFGWMTPSAHADDFKQTEQFIREFRDEWKCDEYDEELFDLKLKRELMEEEGGDTTEIDFQIEKLEKKIDKMDCQRFEDFG